MIELFSRLERQYPHSEWAELLFSKNERDGKLGWRLEVPDLILGFASGSFVGETHVQGKFFYNEKLHDEVSGDGRSGYEIESIRTRDGCHHTLVKFFHPALFSLHGPYAEFLAKDPGEMTVGRGTTDLSGNWNTREFCRTSAILKREVYSSTVTIKSTTIRKLIEIDTKHYIRWKMLEFEAQGTLYLTDTKQPRANYAHWCRDHIVFFNEDDIGRSEFTGLFIPVRSINGRMDLSHLDHEVYKMSWTDLSTD